MPRILSYLKRIAETPPFNLLSGQVVQWLPAAPLTKIWWNACPRPHYLLGVYKAACQAKAEGRPAISVIEFGVASGQGLLCLQDCAAEVERRTGIRISVFGFDSGAGLPQSCGDYRDHPDKWTSGDYPMDVEWLRAQLSSRSELVLGDVRNTVQEFLARADLAPIGFIAFDLDLYSSTTAALAVLAPPNTRTLRRTFLYFDDTESEASHRYAGELLAIDEFNQRHPTMKIDRWRGVNRYSLYWHPLWLAKMYIAHDLQAITQTSQQRAPLNL